MPEASVLMVGTEPAVVETDLVAGRLPPAAGMTCGRGATPAAVSCGDEGVPTGAGPGGPSAQAAAPPHVLLPDDSLARRRPQRHPARSRRCGPRSGR